MDILSQFGTNEKLELEGRWVEFDQNTSFKVAAMGNKNFQRVFSRLYKQNKVALESKTPAAEALSERVMAEVMSKTILLDWKGPVKLGGKDCGTYSQENAFEALLVRKFREYITNLSEDAEGYRLEQDEETAKN